MVEMWQLRACSGQPFEWPGSRRKQRLLDPFGAVLCAFLKSNRIVLRKHTPECTWQRGGTLWDKNCPLGRRCFSTEFENRDWNIKPQIPCFGFVLFRVWDGSHIASSPHFGLTQTIQIPGILMVKCSFWTSKFGWIRFKKWLCSLPKSNGPCLNHIFPWLTPHFHGQNPWKNQGNLYPCRNGRAVTLWGAAFVQTTAKPARVPRNASAARSTKKNRGPWKYCSDFGKLRDFLRVSLGFYGAFLGAFMDSMG